MTKLNQYQVQQARTAGCTNNPLAQYDLICLHHLLHMSTTTQKEADLVLKEKYCLVYHYPESNKLNYHMTTCKFFKKYRINFRYNQRDGQRCSNYDKNRAHHDRNKGLGAEDFRKVAVINEKKKDRVEKEQVAATAASLTTVGQVGKVTKTPEKTKVSIDFFEDQTTNTTAGRLRRAGTMGSFASDFSGATSFVDTSTVCNTCNVDSKD